MLLVARARPERVAGLVGIAAAPDFTEDLMWAQFPEDDRARLRRDGVLLEVSRYGPTPYPIALKLIEEGRSHLLLRDALPIACPVRLLHGMADPDVPWQTSLRLCERLAAADVNVTLVKDGDHRLSRPQDLDRICSAVAELSGLLFPPLAGGA
jgi:pimeloyl-ACP methyl ester carboxylesterase